MDEGCERTEDDSEEPVKEMVIRRAFDKDAYTSVIQEQIDVDDGGETSSIDRLVVIPTEESTDQVATRSIAAAQMEFENNAYETYLEASGRQTRRQSDDQNLIDEAERRETQSRLAQTLRCAQKLPPDEDLSSRLEYLDSEMDGMMNELEQNEIELDEEANDLQGMELCDTDIPDARVGDLNSASLEEFMDNIENAAIDEVDREGESSCVDLYDEPDRVYAPDEDQPYLCGDLPEIEEERNVADVPAASPNREELQKSLDFVEAQHYVANLEQIDKMQKRYEDLYNKAVETQRELHKDDSTTFNLALSFINADFIPQWMAIDNLRRNLKRPKDFPSPKQERTREKKRVCVVSPPPQERVSYLKATNANYYATSPIKSPAVATKPGAKVYASGIPKKTPTVAIKATGKICAAPTKTSRKELAAPSKFKKPATPYKLTTKTSAAISQSRIPSVSTKSSAVTKSKICAAQMASNTQKPAAAKISSAIPRKQATKRVLKKASVDPIISTCLSAAQVCGPRSLADRCGYAETKFKKNIQPVYLKSLKPGARVCAPITKGKLPPKKSNIPIGSRLPPKKPTIPIEASNICESTSIPIGARSPQKKPAIPIDASNICDTSIIAEIPARVPKTPPAKSKLDDSLDFLDDSLREFVANTDAFHEEVEMLLTGKTKEQLAAEKKSQKFLKRYEAVKKIEDKEEQARQRKLLREEENENCEYVYSRITGWDAALDEYFRRETPAPVPQEIEEERPEGVDWVESYKQYESRKFAELEEAKKQRVMAMPERVRKRFLAPPMPEIKPVDEMMTSENLKKMVMESKRRLHALLNPKSARRSIEREPCPAKEPRQEPCKLSRIPRRQSIVTERPKASMLPPSASIVGRQARGSKSFIPKPAYKVTCKERRRASLALPPGYRVPGQEAGKRSMIPPPGFSLKGRESAFRQSLPSMSETRKKYTVNPESVSKARPKSASLCKAPAQRSIKRRSSLAALQALQPPQPTVKKPSVQELAKIRQKYTIKPGTVFKAATQPARRSTLEALQALQPPQPTVKKRSVQELAEIRKKYTMKPGNVFKAPTEGFTRKPAKHALAAIQPPQTATIKRPSAAERIEIKKRYSKKFGTTLKTRCEGRHSIKTPTRRETLADDKKSSGRKRSQSVFEGTPPLRLRAKLNFDAGVEKLKQNLEDNEELQRQICLLKNEYEAKLDFIDQLNQLSEEDAQRFGAEFEAVQDTVDDPEERKDLIVFLKEELNCHRDYLKQSAKDKICRAQSLIPKPRKTEASVKGGTVQKWKMGGDNALNMKKRLAENIDNVNKSIKSNRRTVEIIEQVEEKPVFSCEELKPLAKALSDPNFKEMSSVLGKAKSESARQKRKESKLPLSIARNLAKRGVEELAKSAIEKEETNEVYKVMMLEKRGVDLKADPSKVVNLIVPSDAPKLGIVGNALESTSEGIITNKLPTTELNTLDPIATEEIALTLKSQRHQLPNRNIAAEQMGGEKIEINSKLEEKAEYLECEVLLETFNIETHFQAKGTTLPNWFPGFFTAFPDEPPVLIAQRSPSAVLLTAWKKLQPDYLKCQSL